MMKTRLFRRTTLHFAHLFFTEADTFIMMTYSHSGRAGTEASSRMRLLKTLYLNR